MNGLTPPSDTAKKNLKITDKKKKKKRERPRDFYPFIPTAADTV